MKKVVEKLGYVTIFAIAVLVLILVAFASFFLGCGTGGGGLIPIHGGPPGIEGTITGGTSETITVWLYVASAEMWGSPLVSEEVVTLEYGSADYSFRDLPSNNYTIMAGSGDVGYYLSGFYPNPSTPTPITVTNYLRTGKGFPVGAFTELVNIVSFLKGEEAATHISGLITSATNEGTIIGVAISTDEAMWSGNVNVVITGYHVEPPTQRYYFTGVPTFEDTYYIGAFMKASGNTSVTPEAGDYVGTAEVTVNSGNPTPTDVDIYLEEFSGFSP